MNSTRGIQVTMLNLTLVGVIGCVLRYTFLHPVTGINYGYLLHAHSHLAFLGWVFMALYVLLIYAYLPSGMQKRKYINLFIVLQIANLGMLVTFPIMGYAAGSIVFSAVHAITAIGFAWVFSREVQVTLSSRHEMSFKFIQWALILMLVSNLAPFALGPVSAIQGKTDLYYSLIYFYLHFQYNGWFTFVLLGLVLWQLERRGANTQTRLIKAGFAMKLVAVFPSYILSVLWTEPNLLWYVLGGLAALIQLIGLVCIIYFVVQEMAKSHLADSLVQRILIWIGILAIVGQHLLMLLSAIPALSSLAFSRNIVIAYLHMVLIGFVSVWLLFFFLKQGFVKENLITRIGLALFLVAFVTTELVLVFQVYITEASRWLFYLAIIQLSGILCLTANVKKINRHVAEGSY